MLLGEAVDVAKFHARYWKTIRDPRTKKITRLGLDSTAAKNAKRKNDITAHTGAEIISLEEMVQRAQTRYLLTTTSSGGNAASERARFVLREIAATLE